MFSSLFPQISTQIFLGGKEMRKSIPLWIAIVLVASMILTACGGAAATTAPVAPAATEAPVATEVATEAPTEAPAVTETPTAIPMPELTTNHTGVKITWFIGLGAGSNPEEMVKEYNFINKFNEKYGDKYYLVPQVVTNATAVDVLKTQVASGETPDIVGPVGVKGMFQFEGAWLDLAPFVTKYKTDLSDFDPALINFYKMGPQGQIGLPFAIYPNALWYNKDLFEDRKSTRLNSSHP
jgi:multiple sugar transport system substrate-binding protein